MKKLFLIATALLLANGAFATEISQLKSKAFNLCMNQALKVYNSDERFTDFNRWYVDQMTKSTYEVNFKFKAKFSRNESKRECFVEYTANVRTNSCEFSRGRCRSEIYPYDWDICLSGMPDWWSGCK